MSDVDKWTVQFYSDTNLALFLETLDYRVPTNLWEVDAVEMTIEFDVEPPHVARRYAEDLGADWFDPE